MKKSCRFVLAVLLCPSISMYNQELTGGRGKRGRGTEKRVKGKERKREKCSNILRYKIYKTMRQHSEHISPSEESLAANWQSADAEQESQNHSSPFLLDLKINKNQKHTWLSPAISAQLIPWSESWSFVEWFVSLKITLLWSTSGFLKNITITKLLKKVCKMF